MYSITSMAKYNFLKPRRRQKQVNHKFEAILGYIVRPYLKITTSE
jgi:hypothetical protein